MPRSEVPETQQRVLDLLNRVSKAADALVEDRQSDAEDNLATILPMRVDAEPPDSREELLAENERLRLILAEAKEVARRLRNKLIVVEDEL